MSNSKISPPRGSVQMTLSAILFGIDFSSFAHPTALVSGFFASLSVKIKIYQFLSQREYACNLPLCCCPAVEPGVIRFCVSTNNLDEVTQLEIKMLQWKCCGQLVALLFWQILIAFIKFWPESCLSRVNITCSLLVSASFTPSFYPEVSCMSLELSIE